MRRRSMFLAVCATLLTNPSLAQDMRPLAVITGFVLQESMLELENGGGLSTPRLENNSEQTTGLNHADSLHG